MTLCILVGIYQRLGRTWYLHLQNTNILFFWYPENGDSRQVRIDQTTRGQMSYDPTVRASNRLRPFWQL
jgi:hypothetical protein